MHAGQPLSQHTLPLPLAPDFPVLTTSRFFRGKHGQRDENNQGFVRRAVSYTTLLTWDRIRIRNHDLMPDLVVCDPRNRVER